MAVETECVCVCMPPSYVVNTNQIKQLKQIIIKFLQFFQAVNTTQSRGY